MFTQSLDQIVYIEFEMRYRIFYRSIFVHHVSDVDPALYVFLLNICVWDFSLVFFPFSRNNRLNKNAQSIVRTFLFICFLFRYIVRMVLCQNEDS